MADEKCRLCPRQCGALREKVPGYCGAGTALRIARAAPHVWEEPCISGTRGSGALFFSGCALRCRYCQNYEISFCRKGSDVTPDRLFDIMTALKEQGVHNFNFVTADHYVPQLVPVLEKAKATFDLPIVWNCSGYESPAMLSMLDGLVDVYLPDFKYADSALAEQLSCAADYPKVALNALDRMLCQTGKPVKDREGLLRRGVLVRHLVLPGYRKNSIDAVKLLAGRFAPSDFLFSLMSQYTPQDRENTPNRRLTCFEYESVKDAVLEAGFDGYFQSLSSAESAFTPPFDGTGVG